MVASEVTRSSRRVPKGDRWYQKLTWYWWTAIGAGAFLLVFGTLIGADYLTHAGKIHGQVSVYAYDVGGLTREEAASSLIEKLSVAENHEIILAHDEDEWAVQGSQVGLEFDVDAMVSQAYSFGRTGNAWNQVLDRVALWFQPESVPIIASFGEEMAINVVSSIETEVNVDPVDSKVRLKDDSFETVEGSDGLMVDVDQLLGSLPGAMVSGRPRMEVPVSVVPMGVTLAEARAAADLAEQLSNATVQVTYESESWTFEQGDIRRLFSFVRTDKVKEGAAAAKISAGDGTVLIPVISEKKVATVVIGATGTAVGTPPVDASFKTAAGSVTIIPSKSGIGADPGVLARDIISALESGDSPSTVAIITTEVQPEVTTEVAEGMGIKERIATYTTSFAPGNAPRVANIHLLAKNLDGTLIGPGETFSFNGTIGERTAEKGYQEAGAIVNGQLVNQAGGGICQVSTTLFNSVLLSGLPVDQRRNHSYYLSQYPTGRDATVSWGGPDFKFTNDLDTWVLISTAVTPSSVTVSIYGTDPGYSIDLTVSDWKNVKQFKVKEVEDDTLETGKQVVETKGINGGQVVLTRTVSKGGSQVRRDTFTSNYVTVNQVVKVGTKPPKNSEKDSLNEDE